MMRWIVESSVKFRLLVVVAAAAVLVGGITQLNNVPVDVLPEFVPPTVEVQTEALGLSAEEVEQLITVPLEQDLLNGVAFMQDIRSESVPGLSRVLMVFEPGTDIFRARQVVTERMTQAHALPQVSKPPQMLQPLSSTNRVMMIGLSSKTLTPIQMSVLARWTIVPRLLGPSGVANVSIWGQRDRQLQVQINPDRLSKQGVTLDQVIESTGNALWVSPLSFVEASTPGTGGFIDTPNQRLGIQHVSPISAADDLAKITIEQPGKENLRLGDVANVVEDHQPLIGDAVVQDGNGLLLVVEKLPEANALEVTRGVEAAVATMRPGFSEIHFDTTVYRPASYIEQSIGNVEKGLIAAAVLVALAFGALFFRWRTALVSLLVIPLSLITAALVLSALGTGINLIILAGFAAALVLVIDDAVIGVDSLARRLREHKHEPDGRSTASVVLEATLEARGTTVIATLAVALAVVPFLFLQDLSGSFFPDLAGAYLLALLSSLLVASLVTPALGLLLVSRGSFRRPEAPLVGLVRRNYQGGLTRVIRTPVLAYAAAGLVAVAALIALPFLDNKLLPTLKEQQLLVQWDGPPGTSLTEMNRVTTRASAELRTVPGVREVAAHVGRAITADRSVGANAAELAVSIDPSADYDTTVAAVRNVVDGYPGLTRSIEPFSNARARQVLTGTESDKDVVVRVYGDDYAVLRGEASKVMSAVSAVDGVSDAAVALPPLEPTLEVEVDLAKAQQFGIKPGDVRRAATTLLSGLTTGSLFEQQKVFDVVVVGTPGVRGSLTSIRELLIDTPSGDQVRLGEVADVRIAPQPGNIKREASSRYLDVGANVSGRSVSDVVGDIDRRLEQLPFALEYHAEILPTGGQPVSRVVALGIAALVGMFLLLQSCFGSWRLAALAVLILPLALTGGVIAALLDGGELSFGSYIGLVSVLGIALRHVALLVDRFRRLEWQQGEPFGDGLVLRGMGEQIAPILTTAVATAGAMLPFVILGSIPGYELLHPLAVVVLGGLVTTMLVSLVVLPVLYLRLGPSPAHDAESSFAWGRRRREGDVVTTPAPVLRQSATGMDPVS